MDWGRGVPSPLVPELLTWGAQMAGGPEVDQPGSKQPRRRPAAVRTFIIVPAELAPTVNENASASMINAKTVN